MFGGRYGILLLPFPAILDLDPDKILADHKFKYCCVKKNIVVSDKKLFFFVLDQ